MGEDEEAHTKIMITTKPIVKVGIVGSGSEAQKLIFRLRKMDSVKIIGICPIDTRQVFSDRSNIRTFSTFLEMVKVEVPDFVHVVGNEKFRKLLCLDILNSGCKLIINDCIPLLIDSELKDGLHEEDLKRIYPMNIFAFLTIKDLILKTKNNYKLGDLKSLEFLAKINIKESGLDRYYGQNNIHWLYESPALIYKYYLFQPLSFICTMYRTVRFQEVIESTKGLLPQRISDHLIVKLLCDDIPCKLTLSFSCIESCSRLEANFPDSRRITVDFSRDTENYSTYLYVCSRVKKLWGSKSVFAFRGGQKIFTISASEFGLSDVLHRSYFENIEHETQVREVVERTSKLVNDIGNMIVNKNLSFFPRKRRLVDDDTSKMVLVTGASGYLGKFLVEELLNRGFRVRVFVRKLSKLNSIYELDIDIYYGDIANWASLEPAIRGVDYVVHAAADTFGSGSEGLEATTTGIKNIIRAQRMFGVDRVIYISSCNVYSVVGLKDGRTVTENDPIEDRASLRGPYTQAKVAAESIIIKEMEVSQGTIICIRPGTFYGENGELFTPIMGAQFRKRIFFIIGLGFQVLPLVYVRNVTDVIVRLLGHNNAHSAIYNLVDSESITKRWYINNVLKKIFPKSLFLYIPYPLVYIVVATLEIVAILFRMNPPLTRFRLKSSQKSLIYSTDAIKRDLGWKARYPVSKAMENLVNFSLLNKASEK